jgi:nucleoside-diphosphate-sugar epimerase
MSQEISRTLGAESAEKNVHVVVGAGQIGPLLAARLVARGHRVRMVRRSTGGPELRGVEWAHGDVTNRQFTDEAFRGAAVVYNCANPDRYDRWDDILPPLMQGVSQGAARAGARLVALDNLYMYGPPPAEGALCEDTPLAPTSKKGELRKRLFEELMAAHVRGDVEVTWGRAPDFFGPGAPRSMVGDRVTGPLAQGRSVGPLGDPDQPHAFSYTQDVAEGLAILGERDEAFGKVWHLPVAWTGTTRGLIQLFAAALGVQPRIRAIPRWVLRVAGLFSGQMRAVVEMMYQWEAPFRVDDSRFRAAFGAAPTPIDRAVEDTVRALGGKRSTGIREAARTRA